MKEIDLLPQWYMTSQRKQQSLRGQYMVIAGVVAMMLAINFAADRSLSTARARLDETISRSSHAKAVIEHARQMSEEIEKISRKVKLLDDIDSRINIANVLSELSFLVDGKVVLGDISFEAVELEKESRGNPSASGLRVARLGKAGAAGYVGDVRFFLTIHGIADQTSDVGKFVRRLEDSEYFRDVSLAFSRSKKIKVSSGSGNNQRQVSEFEISCDLANYRIGEVGSGLR